jgi:hypothetical protein
MTGNQFVGSAASASACYATVRFFDTIFGPPVLHPWPAYVALLMFTFAVAGLADKICGKKTETTGDR